MDLAASKICSSKFKDSSASWSEKVTVGWGVGEAERKGTEVETSCCCDRRKGRWSPDLGFGPGLQLLQLFGCSLNGGCGSQELILSNDSRVLWVYPLCSCGMEAGEEAEAGRAGRSEALGSSFSNTPPLRTRSTG